MRKIKSKTQKLLSIMIIISLISSVILISIPSTKVDNKWKEIKDNLDGSERKEIKAELKHIKEMKRLELKTTISEAEADFEYAKTIYNGIKNIYQERKKLMKQIR